MFPYVILSIDEIMSSLLTVIDKVRERYQKQREEDSELQKPSSVTRLKKLHVNLFESSVFELANLYPTKLIALGLKEEVLAFIGTYKEHFEWCKTMARPFFDENLAFLKDSGHDSIKIQNGPPSSMHSSFQTGMPPSASNGVQTRGKQAGTTTKQDDYFKQIVERTKATIQKKSKMTGFFPSAAVSAEKAPVEQSSTQEDNKAASPSLNFQSLVM